MRNLFVVCLLFISGLGFSQNLYDIRWNSGGVDYYGFMVFFAEDDVYMRVGYYAEDGSYNLVHSDYAYAVDEEAGDVITMVATNSEYVQNETDDEWDADHLFWYKDETTGEFVGPYIISNSDLEAENYDNIIEPEFIEVDMAQLDAEYLKFFYYTDEADYKILLEAGQDHEEDQANNSTGAFTDTNSGSNNQNTETENTDAENEANANTVSQTDISTNTNNTNNTTTTDNQDYSSGSIYGNEPVKIHLIILANTAISDIGASTAVDMNNMVAEVSGISEVLGVPVNKVLFTEKDFTKKNVETFMAGFKPGLNDIVIFMYSGHGYRFSDQTEPYPQLDMRYSEYQEFSDEATMNLKQVFNEIVKKGARLNIVLGDCCNSDVGFSRSVGSSFMNSRSSVDPDFEKLKQLFIKSDGDIIAAGASKGQYSWCTQSGGFFTLSFIAALREEISKFKTDDVPDWGDVMTGTKTGTRKKTDLCSDCEPQDVVYDKYMK